MTACACGCGKETRVHGGKHSKYAGHGCAMRALHADPEKKRRLLEGHAAWRASPEGQVIMAQMRESRARMVRRPEARAATSRRVTGMEFQKNKATIKPRIRDIAWAAGFLEGEGSFFLQGGKYSQVSAVQVQEEPLQRLAEMFGGKVWHRKSRTPSSRPTAWWRVSGARARGVGMTLYPMMSPKRKHQIRVMLELEPRVSFR